VAAGAGTVPIDKQAFDRDGYLVFDPGVSEETIDGVVAEANRQFRPRDRSGWLPFRRGASASAELSDGERFQDAWAKSENARKIALAPATLEVLRILYGREPRPVQTLNFRVGTQQRAHADAVHFNTEPRGFMCAVWVALEDIDMENGPLVYYPGSHKLPEVMPGDVGIHVSPDQEAVSGEDYYAAYEPYIEKLIEREGLEPHYGTLRKGQALMWATNLLHGGMPVRDPSRTRHSQVTHYFFEGCKLWSPLLTSEGHTAWREAPPKNLPR
jgi:ectoine hydroxylase-related dioxygenase (phytanoyl-CoA dioxygenase family)